MKGLPADELRFGPAMSLRISQYWCQAHTRTSYFGHLVQGQQRCKRSLPVIHCYRQQLQHLADGSSGAGIQAVHSRPGSPWWLHRQSGRLTAMFPVFMHGSADDPLLSAFIQVLLHLSEITIAALAHR